ncbi:MAG: 4-(cytidine 5'-diphospho)-2-C-methyl-D-erythritol kinase [Chlamydiae bacterium]|nr:4-(cytidine 5'-diphospho)-2-C-methyl-D-erythritol kinase [Chlamydiota bacterium]
MQSKQDLHLSFEEILKDELSSSSFSLVCHSPSKVNLFFRVLSKRLDGFHEIASLYQAIGLYDTLYFRKNNKLQLTCSDKELKVDESNLVMKAALLFFTNTQIPEAVHIHLDKKVPMQAGLGGGSANAATTLWGLNEFFGRVVSTSTLIEWASCLGSDVPFFFSNGTAYCTGRGEKIESISLNNLPSSITIVKPMLGLSTPLVYKNCLPNSFIQRDPKKSLSSFLIGQGEYYNDLETPSFSLIPSLQEIKETLKSYGFMHVVMCGSGTAFFCIGPGIIPKNPPWHIFEAPLINRSDNGWYE